MQRHDNALVWFRRDLRLDDHAALHHALADARRVWCAFVFDRAILEALPRADRRVEFILESLRELDADLRSRGAALIVLHGFAEEEIPQLALRLTAGAVYANRDYEPNAVARDDAVRAALSANGCELRLFKDQVIFERDEVMTAAGTPFSVFTPYKNAWLRRLDDHAVRPWPVAHGHDRLAPPPPGLAVGLPSLAELGFARTNLGELGIPVGAAGASRLFEDFRERIDAYHERRDTPAANGTSGLSVHLRFGTISIRALAGYAWNAARGTGGRGAEVWLSELIWREFYFQILHHHPHVVDAAFKPAYDAIRWESGALADERFAAWCEGRTGYPLVDAAMLQLDRTGAMHNRLRMVTASFLVKDLGIDWRRGERLFAERLNDYDLAANNGGWQWAASTGCDAQPWFRIFNPVTQSEKFDPQGLYIKRHLPQLAALDGGQVHAPWRLSQASQEAAAVRIGSDYPAPIVDHAAAREATLARYGAVRRT